MKKLLLDLIEFDRLTKEGGTVKNVTENMRSLAICVLFGTVIFYVYKITSDLSVSYYVFFGLWVVFYGFLVVWQSALLFYFLLRSLINLLPLFIQKKAEKLPVFFKNFFVMLLFCLVGLAIILFLEGVFLALLALITQTIKPV